MHPYVDILVCVCVQWLSETIVVRLVAEIDKANQQMAAHGIVDCNVGEATISQLRQVAASRAQMLPTLHMLVPFLDVTSHQEYLVYELRGNNDSNPSPNNHNTIR